MVSESTYRVVYPFNAGQFLYMTLYISVQLSAILCSGGQAKRDSVQWWLVLSAPPYIREVKNIANPWDL